MTDWVSQEVPGRFFDGIEPIMGKKSLFIARQSSQPHGWFGHIVARVMAGRTEAANEVALQYLNVRPQEAVLEVGFGPGRTVREIVRRVPTATVSGVDPSDVMVDLARETCHAYRQRVDLRRGSVAGLPFNDQAFNKAFTVHTTYFWPQLLPGLREVRRVLREGGSFVLGFRPKDDEFAVATLPTSVYSLHTIEEMVAALASAGFVDVNIERTVLKKGFIAWAICQSSQDS